MLKITLSLLDLETVQVIAQKRGIDVNDLVSSLIQREAAVEITNWRSMPKPNDTEPVTAQARGTQHGNG